MVYCLYYSSRYNIETNAINESPRHVRRIGGRLRGILLIIQYSLRNALGEKSEDRRETMAWRWMWFSVAFNQIYLGASVVSYATGAPRIFRMLHRDCRTPNLSNDLYRILLLQNFSSDWYINEKFNNGYMCSRLRHNDFKLILVWRKHTRIFIILQ